MTLRLAFVGDTQRILPVERLVHPFETNDAGRRGVARAILTEPLDALVHLGDLVGHSSDYWRFDQAYPPAALARLQLYACRGNHDCGGLWFGSGAEFERRFPDSAARLQSVDFANTRLLLLDTNRRCMTDAQWRGQIEQYHTALETADRDPNIGHLLVAGHHPPFTNARFHPPSQAASQLVSAFVHCTKSRIFFSGHAHGYERVRHQGRHFVVTGGGGGARFSHLRGTRRRFPSELDLLDPHPMHYVLLEVSTDSLSVSVRAWSDDSRHCHVLDSFEVPPSVVQASARS